MSTTTTTDRARLVDLALANGWVVSNMGQHFTELTKETFPSITLLWSLSLDDDKRDSFAEVSNGYGATLTTDIAEAAQLIRGDRYRDAANARYFTVVEPADGDLNNYAGFRETDKDFGFVQGLNIPTRERAVLVELAEAARGLARATGSRASTQVETVFGIELHVTWKRA